MSTEPRAAQSDAVCLPVVPLVGELRGPLIDSLLLSLSVICCAVQFVPQP
jgi:hypothetical protein